MDKKRLITSLTLIAFSTVVLVETCKLPRGTLREPDSGFWPLVLGGALALFSLIHLILTLKGIQGEKAPFWSTPGAWKYILQVMGSLVIFCFVFEWLGFMVSVFVLMGFLVRVVKPMQWRWVFVTALLSSVVPYLIFKGLLGVELPPGILGL